MQDVVYGCVYVPRLIIPKKLELDGAFGKGRVNDKLLPFGNRDAGTADAADPGFGCCYGDHAALLQCRKSTFNRKSSEYPGKLRIAARGKVW